MSPKELIEQVFVSWNTFSPPTPCTGVSKFLFAVQEFRSEIQVVSHAKPGKLVKDCDKIGVPSVETCVAGVMAGKLANDKLGVVSAGGTLDEEAKRMKTQHFSQEKKVVKLIEAILRRQKSSTPSAILKRSAVPRLRPPTPP